ncbi:MULTISPECIES: hypothetical protein [Niallia]|jgi:hypothetical protein|nr:hypothetical protein [Niallia circulans]
MKKISLILSYIFYQLVLFVCKQNSEVKVDNRQNYHKSIENYLSNREQL